MVADTTHFLYQANKEGKTILLEGQLGSLRDPDHGIYPYTTSSSPLAGYGCVGAGVSPRDMTDIVCVTKAYSSCVGAGAFVSKLDGAAGDELRRRGGDAGEFGATTGRARDVGWFDAVATRYGVMVQGATQVVLTNLDVLGNSGRDSGVRRLRSGRQADYGIPGDPDADALQAGVCEAARLEVRHSRREVV